MSAVLYCGNALDILRSLPDGSVRSCVTSPPYWGLRDYGVVGQLGLERTPEEYVAHLVAVFREVRRVLADDGTLWLNLGDSYDDKQLMMMPARAALALQADGWWLRSEIIWSKQNAMPESVRDRPSLSHEHLFLLAKGQWVSRVVQLANLDRECFHLGQYARLQRPNMGPTGFVVALAATIFDAAQAQHDHRLPPFYAEVWQQSADGRDRDLVGGLPPLGRLAVPCARFLSGQATAEQTVQEVGRLWCDLTDSDDLLITRTSAQDSGTPSVLRNRDGAVTVHHVGEIGQIEFSHGRIIVKKPTTCNYYYDAASIAEDLQSGRARSGNIKRDLPGDRDARGIPNDHRGRSVPWENGGLGRNSRTVWTIPVQPYRGAHFATFPEELARRCILAGTSQAGHCPECGKVWRRVLETTYENDITTSGRPAVGNRKKRNEAGDPGRGMQERTRRRDRTLGWEASCDHDADPVPDVVLDPFCGSGTTCQVATGNGRAAIGIDLNPDYLDLAVQRIGPLLCAYDRTGTDQ